MIVTETNVLHLLISRLMILASSMRWNLVVSKMFRMVKKLRVILAVWPTGCNIIFKMILRPVCKEFKIVSDKFLREIRIICFRNKEEQMVEFPVKELICPFFMDRISVNTLIKDNGQARLIPLTKTYDLIHSTKCCSWSIYSQEQMVDQLKVSKKYLTSVYNVFFILYPLLLRIYYI